MKFYEIDNALQEAIAAADKPVRLKIEIQFAGHFESVFEQDIIEANFFGLKEAAGGTTARGKYFLIIQAVSFLTDFYPTAAVN